MSADNFWLVRRNWPSGFSPVMGFASDETKPDVRADAPVFATPEEALASVLGDYAEYGHSIDPECYAPTVGEWVWCCERLREQIEDECAEHGEDCPDALIVRGHVGVFGLPIRDGGDAFVQITYCPWCGGLLPVTAGEVEDRPCC